MTDTAPVPLTVVPSVASMPLHAAGADDDVLTDAR